MANYITCDEISALKVKIGNRDVTGNILNGTSHVPEGVEELVAQLDGLTASVDELNVLDGIVSTTDDLNMLKDITASPAEINILHGARVSTEELNTLDGITASTSELNLLDGCVTTTQELNTIHGLYASSFELNKLSGVTAVKEEFNILDGLTASTAELNTLSGLTATTSELNKLHGLDATAYELDSVAAVVPGTASRNKAAILGPNKNLDQLHLNSGGLWLGNGQLLATANEINLRCDESAMMDTMLDAGEINVNTACTHFQTGGPGTCTIGYPQRAAFIKILTQYGDQTTPVIVPLTTIFHSQGATQALFSDTGATLVLISQMEFNRWLIIANENVQLS